MQLSSFKSLSRINIDGGLKASLDWTLALHKATAVVNAGQQIVWQIDLGLFTRLDMPLSNQMQLQALNLSLEHFYKKVWTNFHAHSVGLVLYTGNLDFSKNFPWDSKLISHWHGWLQDRFISVIALNEECSVEYSDLEEVHPQNISNAYLSDLVKLFCRDTAADYLNMLAGSIFDSLPLYLSFKANEPLDPLLFYQLCSAELFERFHCVFEEGVGKKWGSHLSGNHDPQIKSESLRVGVCLPGAEIVKPTLFKDLRQAIVQLQHHNISYVVIPEKHLIQQWEGLDYIVYASKCLASHGKRKLQGFCAAAGTTVAVDAPIGLPNEILFVDFIKQKNWPSLH